MRNQFFGDNKDLWKYDLCLDILQTGMVARFVFIPMLTADRGQTLGLRNDRSLARAGTENKELVRFLDGCIESGKKNVNQIGTYFSGLGYPATVYRGRGRKFTHADRKAYFDGIPDDLLTAALILVDPDNGLEVKHPTAAHLLYREVDDLYRRMDNESILMLYQFFPRRRRGEYLNMRMEEIKDRVMGDYPVCAWDNEIAFFFLTKSEAIEHELIHVIEEYQERYS